MSVVNPTKQTTNDGKRERVPFGGNRQRLSVANKDPNYFYYFFNMVEDRIQRALNAGYVFVTKKEAAEREITVGDPDVAHGSEDLNDKVTKVVGKYDNGQPIVGVLMKIHNDLHEEDLAEKARNNDEIDNALQRGGISREQGYISGIDYDPYSK